MHTASRTNNRYRRIGLKEFCLTILEALGLTAASALLIWFSAPFLLGLACAGIALLYSWSLSVIAVSCFSAACYVLDATFKFFGYRTHFYQENMYDLLVEKVIGFYMSLIDYGYQKYQKFYVQILMVLCGASLSTAYAAMLSSQFHNPPFRYNPVFHYHRIAATFLGTAAKFLGYTFGYVTSFVILKEILLPILMYDLTLIGANIKYKFDDIFRPYMGHSADTTRPVVYMTAPQWHIDIPSSPTTSNIFKDNDLAIAAVDKTRDKMLAPINEILEKLPKAEKARVKLCTNADEINCVISRDLIVDPVRISVKTKGGFFTKDKVVLEPRAYERKNLERLLVKTGIGKSPWTRQEFSIENIVDAPDLKKEVQIAIQKDVEHLKVLQVIQENTQQKLEKQKCANGLLFFSAASYDDVSYSEAPNPASNNSSCPQPRP